MAVADRAADSGQRVILLDELQRIEIAPLGRHADIALYGQMRRTCRFARRCAGLIAVDLYVVTVVEVPLLRTPRSEIGQLSFRVFDGAAVLVAELLAKLRRADRADLDALAAGHALFCRHMRTVGGGGQVRCIEQLRGTKGVADARRTVTDADDLIRTVQIRDLVNKALFLGALEDLDGLIVCNIMRVLLCLDAVFCHIAECDAEIALDIAGALMTDALLPTAGAHIDGQLVIFLQPV